MARSFNGGQNTTDRAENTSTAARGSAGTISVWFKPTWNSGDGAEYVIFEHFNSGTPGGELVVLKFIDNNVYAGWNGAGHGGSDNRIIIADTGLFSAGRWTNIIFDWSTAATSQHIFFNNVQKGSTGAFSTFTITDTCVGNFAAVTGGANGAGGSIAEYTEWNVVLTSNERAALAAGVNARFVRPGNITLYYPLFGLSSPEPEFSGKQKNLTLTGTAAANHAPVTLWTRRTAGFPLFQALTGRRNRPPFQYWAA